MKIGPRRSSNVPVCGAVDARADDVGGHEVRRELDAPEAQVERARERLREERLGDARDPLEEHVAAGEERGEELVHGGLLPDHGLANLGLEARGGGGGWHAATVAPTGLLTP